MNNAGFFVPVLLATMLAAAASVCVPVSTCERAHDDNAINTTGRIPLTRNFVAAAVEKVAPSVVNILCLVETPLAVGASSGSGFIISDDGFIVTNAHVVAPAASGKVLVTMRNGKKRRGYVHSLDQASDIALVKLEADSTDSAGYGMRSYESGADVLVPVKLGTSGNVRGGEFVVALGSPMQLQNSASLGIISATARHASELGLANSRSEYLQTDAAINVGNSGGPLVNLDGEVIGINTMKVKGTDGISFAIPIDVASQIINQLKANKKVIRPYVGMKLANFLPDSHGGNGGSRSSSWNPFTRGGGGGGGGSRKSGRQLRDEEFYNTKDMQVIVLDVVVNSPAHHCGLERCEATRLPILVLLSI